MKEDTLVTTVSEGCNRFHWNEEEWFKISLCEGWEVGNDPLDWKSVRNGVVSFLEMLP